MPKWSSLSSVQAPALPAATRNAAEKAVLFPNGWSSSSDCRFNSFDCRLPCTRRTAGREIFHYLTGVPSPALGEKVSVLQPPTDYPSLPAMPMPPSTMEMAIPQPPYLLHSQETLQTHLEYPQPLSDVTTQMNETDFFMAINLDEQILSRINQSIATDCSMFRPRRPSSTAYKTAVWDKLYSKTQPCVTKSLAWLNLLVRQLGFAI